MQIPTGILNFYVHLQRTTFNKQYLILLVNSPKKFYSGDHLNCEIGQRHLCNHVFEEQTVLPVS